MLDYYILLIPVSLSHFYKNPDQNQSNPLYLLSILHRFQSIEFINSIYLKLLMVNYMDLD